MIVRYGRGHICGGRVYATTGNRARSRLVTNREANIRRMMQTLGVDYV